MRARQDSRPRRRHRRSRAWRAGRRDLVVELLEHLVIVYIATRGGGDEDAFADLTETALEIVDGFPPVPRLSPRGVEATTTP